MKSTTAPHTLRTDSLSLFSGPAFLIAGILFIAMNLRAPFTSAGPLLDVIRDSLQLSSTQAGLLITLPLLAFAAVSPFAARLARAYGLERSLFAALVVLGAGIVLRSLGPTWCLYLGTCVMGGAIAIGNVLLPSLLKRDFAGHITLLTAVYALTMGMMAALGSVGAVPLSQWGGWRLALGAFLILPVLSALIWLPQLRKHSRPAIGTADMPTGGTVWHSALAWQVTLFLGINSFVYYVAAGWLPSILADAGYTPTQAGNLHGLMQLTAATPGLIVVPLVRRLKDQRALAFGMSMLAMAGLVGLLAAPHWAAVWTSLFGFGAGAALILGLAFVSLRAGNPHQAAALSGMAQCVGYLLAAVGPTLSGRVHDATGNWTATLAGCAALCLAMGLLGLFAGRALQLTDRQ